MKRIVLISLILTMFMFLNSYGTKPADNENRVVTNLSKADFIAKVMDYETNTTQWIFKGDKPCIIDFYADWCGPCRIASPILEELAEAYKGKIDVYKVNVDNERELSQLFGISSIPAFLYCPMEGKPSMAAGIGRDQEQTKKMFIENIEKLLLKK